MSWNRFFWTDLQGQRHLTDEAFATAVIAGSYAILFGIIAAFTTFIV